MKKIFITMLAAVAATVSFAQNPKIDKEIKAAGSYDAGKAILDQQLATLTDDQKAKAYNELCKFVQPEVAKIPEQLQKGEKPNYDNLLHALNCAVECAKYDAKGKFKENATIGVMRPHLINAANSTEDNNKKLEYSLCYINSGKSPLFAEYVKAGDNYLGYANYFASYVYVQNKDYANAKVTAKEAMKDAKVKDGAANIYLAAVTATLKNKQDTLAYIEDMKQIDQGKYFGQIVSLYDAIGESEMAKKLVDDELARNPNNKLAYFVRGNSEMGLKKYDEAIADFKKVVEIDPEYVSGWFNLGATTEQKAFDLQEKYTDKQGKIAVDKKNEVVTILNDAIKAFEKVQELDPNHEKISRWPMQLRMLYNAVGNKAKADEITKMLGDGE